MKRSRYRVVLEEVSTIIMEQRFAWNILILILAAAAVALPAYRSVSHNRVKRQGSQMDPFLRRVCDNGDGAFGHPYACGSYVQCFNGSYSEIDCPGNMYFNIKAKNCDFRRKIKCKLVDGIVETEEQSKKFGPEIPVEVEHPLKTTATKEKREAPNQRF